VRRPGHRRHAGTAAADARARCGIQARGSARRAKRHCRFPRGVQFPLQAAAAAPDNPREAHRPGPVNGMGRLGGIRQGPPDRGRPFSREHRPAAVGGRASPRFPRG
jgi:hypothetical protein